MPNQLDDPSDLSKVHQALDILLSSSLFYELEEALWQQSLFQVLKIEKREQVHAALIRWFLDPNEGHGMGSRPLHQFLMMVCRKISHSNSLGSSENFELRPTVLDGLNLEDAFVENEPQLMMADGKPIGRADVLVQILNENQGPIPVMLIEYKVEAGVHGAQVDNYRRWAIEQKERVQQAFGLSRPILVYMSPVPSGQSEELFKVRGIQAYCVLDYDDLTGWLRSLLQSNRISSRAKLLTDEFLACLSSMEWVQNDHAQILADQMMSEMSESIEILKTVGMSQFCQEYTHHRKALNKLGIFSARIASRGNSAIIGMCQKLIQGLFRDGKWKMTGKTGSILVWSRSYEQALKARFQNEMDTLGNPSLQFYMGRPEHETTLFRSYIVNSGGEPGERRERFRKLIKTTAEELRTRLDETIKNQGMLETKGYTITKIILNLPGLNQPSDDVEDKIGKSHREELYRAATAIEALREPTEKWIEEDLGSILKSWK